jgi:hypothetical protein
VCDQTSTTTTYSPAGPAPREIVVKVLGEEAAGQIELHLAQLYGVTLGDRPGSRRQER